MYFAEDDRQFRVRSKQFYKREEGEFPQISLSNLARETAIISVNSEQLLKEIARLLVY